MSVILEFTIDREEFLLGSVLGGVPGGVPGVHIELERVVPTGGEVMPFVWARGDDHAGFEASVRDRPEVKEFIVLDRVGDRALYRIDWTDPPTDLVDILGETEATVLEAQGGERWQFRIRFPDEEHLSRFHDLFRDAGIPVHVERTYSLIGDEAPATDFGLTDEQREALVLALRQGYFATPSETDLESVASELGVTSQAVSKRIRRANEKVLEHTLLSPDGDE